MKKSIKEAVKEKYTEVVTTNSSCCDSSCCSPGESFVVGESYEDLKGYNPDADLALGCGIPTEFAQIEKGDTVLDLGAGAGNDVFVARSLVGEEGKVIGIDMTEAMVAKAKQNKKKLGYENVEFLLGDIEEMPLADNAVDVVISNCVMNLVPDKEKAYAEVYRVIKEGGHFSISDIVVTGGLTPAIQEAAALYVGCISGAMAKLDYFQLIEAAGFKNVKVVKERALDLPDELFLKHISSEELQAFRQKGSIVHSVTVFAEK